MRNSSRDDGSSCCMFIIVSRHTHQSKTLQMIMSGCNTVIKNRYVNTKTFINRWQLCTFV